MAVEAGCRGARSRAATRQRFALALHDQRRDRVGDHCGRTSANVSEPSRISSGPADCSRRAATLTASPTASRSSVPVITSPVFTPIRSVNRDPNSRSSSSLSLAGARAARLRHARREGRRPRAAPARRRRPSRRRRRTSRPRRRVARRRPGPCRSTGTSTDEAPPDRGVHPIAVESARSQKKMVTRRRDSRSGARSGDPQARQNRACSGFDSPHPGQANMGQVWHFSQLAFSAGV